MFNTHWILIPMSFCPAGIACGILGLNPEGVLLTGVLISLFWIHIVLYAACRVLIALQLNWFPNAELWIALGCFSVGYGAAFIVGYEAIFVVAYGHQHFQVFCISMLAGGMFFIHDFVFGVTLLFGNFSFHSLFNMPPLSPPEWRQHSHIKHWTDD